MTEIPPGVMVFGPEAARWQKNRHVRDYLSHIEQLGEVPVALATTVSVEMKSSRDHLAVAAGVLATDRSLNVFKPGLMGWTAYEPVVLARVTKILRPQELGRGFTKRSSFVISFEYDGSEEDGAVGDAISATCSIAGPADDIARLHEIITSQRNNAKQRKRQIDKKQKNEELKRVESIMARARADQPITPDEFSLLKGENSDEYWNVILPRRQEQARVRGEENELIVERALAGFRLTQAQAARLQEIDEGLHAAWVERAAALARELGVRPASTPIRTPLDAEKNAERWMRYWGFEDAQSTGPGADEGIDVGSSEAVAQVKAYMVPVGRPDLQNLAGVAAVERKQAIFFALSGYTDQALEWAERADMALFTFDLMGDPEPLNSAALRLTGLLAD